MLSDGPRILAVRLGAMGDVIQCLPAVASLKHGIPRSHVTWVIEPRWAPLLEGNPYVDRVILLDRRSLAGLRAAWRDLRARRYDIAVDFQGLLKSALVASAARAERLFGFTRALVRERPAAWFYSVAVGSKAEHVVDRYLDLAAAAGASSLLRTFPLPAGHAEGSLPASPFVLASPMAGWAAKEWPMDFYSELGRLLEAGGCTLVLNGRTRIDAPHTHAHVSGLPGLIDATRRAVAVVGVDSGPLHLAAALGKPGVAIFGPTDPARNGPRGGAIAVLRSPAAVTSYKRRGRQPRRHRGPELARPGAAMRDISPQAVHEALRAALAKAGIPVGRPA
ncbi:MAG: glycosyltransferase family 9 protein [Bryobacteraceae bacterium]|jgi:heptosyltransferase-1